MSSGAGEPAAQDPLEALVLACLDADDPHAELQRRTAGQPDLHAAALPVLEQVLRLEGDDEPPLPAIPDVIIEGLLGRGGQAVVHRGRQEYLGRPVAVKVLAPGADAAFVRRFRREAQILATLQHPHIVACHQAGVAGSGQCWLVMELIEGPNLRQWLNQHGPLPPAAALRLTTALAEALAAAQRAGIVHRDVKPENVLLQPRPDGPADFPFAPKLADLGLARAQTAGLGSLRTTVGMLLGTPATMAPEQIDDPAGADHRADIYGLGCVLFHTLAGRPAFPGTVVTAILKQKAEPAPHLRTVAPHVPAPLAALVACMLERDPAARPQDYDELQRRLADCASAPRSRSRALPAIVVLTVGIGLAVLAWPRPEPAVPPPPPALTVLHPPAVREGDPVILEVRAPAAVAGETCTWRQTAGPALRLPPEPGRQLRFVAPRGAAGAELGFAVALVQGAATHNGDATIRVEGDPAAEPLPAGAAQPLLVRSRTPLSNWTVSDARYWLRDDQGPPTSLGARANRRVGTAAASHLLPRGDWQFRGSIDPGFTFRSVEFPRERCQLCGLRLEFADGGAVGLAIRPVAAEPDGYAVTLERLEPAADGWQVVAVLAEERRVLTPEAPLLLTVVHRAGELGWQWGDRPAITVRPTDWGTAWPPGQVTIHLENGNACFRDLLLQGL